MIKSDIDFTNVQTFKERYGFEWGNEKEKKFVVKVLKKCIAKELKKKGQDDEKKG